MSLRFRGWISSHRFLLFALLIWALIALHFRLPVPRTHTSKQRQSRQQKVFQYKSKHGIAKSQEICDEKSQLQRVVITVKTGATEAHKRIPIQLQTSLRCAPNLFIFSDMEDDIGNVHIYDALEGIPDSVKENNSDFDLYRKQKVLNDPVKIATILGNMKDPRRPEDLAAWTLDKYKNLHIVEKTWNMKPDMDWYMHIDADTYVSWPTLMLWLEKLDPSQKSFIGSLSFVIENAFAHGGSGILLSREATRDFIDTHNGSVASWNDKIHDNCCGDYVLALALKDLDMNVKNANPTVNGDPPAVIPFSLDRWCQPLVTMHHVAPAEAQMLHEFEARRKDKSVRQTEFKVSFFIFPIPDSCIETFDICGAFQRFSF